MRKELLVFLISLTFLTSWGQTEQPYIEVVGSAESEFSPNIIVISIRLREYEENRTKVPLDKIEAEFMKAVKKSNIDKDKIQLSDVTLNSVMRRKKDRDLFSEKIYEIVFSKTEEVLSLLTNLETVKLDYMNIVKLSHTEIKKYRLELKIEALKAAGRKADALLQAVGSTRGHPLLIDETTRAVTWSPQNTNSNTLYSIMDREDLGISEIPLKKIKLRFEVRARFAIE